jgi:hypothetical protein
MTRHDHLVTGLEAVIALLEAETPLAADARLGELVLAFATTPDPGADERVLPLYTRARELAAALHGRIAGKLHATALERRAHRAYGDQVP